MCSLFKTIIIGKGIKHVDPLGADELPDPWILTCSRLKPRNSTAIHHPPDPYLSALRPTKPIFVVHVLTYGVRCKVIGNYPIHIIIVDSLLTLEQLI